MTDRYASASFVYLPTSPIRTWASAASWRLTSASHSERSGALDSIPNLSRMRSSVPSARKYSGTL
jgi:hypothetical protein